VHGFVAGIAQTTKSKLGSHDLCDDCSHQAENEIDVGKPRQKIRINKHMASVVSNNKYAELSRLLPSTFKELQVVSTKLHNEAKHIEAKMWH
jgi:hypothetical protein